MDIVRISSRRAGTLFAAGLLLFATMLPALASAATVTSRSIALSSSVIDADDVTYNVVFTSPGTTQDFVLDFCDSPALNTTCNAPSGFDITTNASISTAGYTLTDIDANTATVTMGTPGTSIDVEIDDVTNPDTAGVFYARITTYAGAESYTDATTLGTVQDSGSVALNATNGFDVSGSVLEELTFCASGADTITSGCASGVTSPNLSLGSGGVLTTALSTGTIYTQISTNAAGGAVVSLKSSETDCGGMVRDGAATNTLGCGITPTHTAAETIATGDAQFGLRILGLGGATGTTALSGLYEGTDFFMNYDTSDNDATGVTGPYGDPIFNTNSGPVADGEADLEFGANISATTPAGVYRANLNLIATGTF